MLGKLLKYDLLHSLKKLSIAALIELLSIYILGLTLFLPSIQSDYSGLTLGVSLFFCITFLITNFFICLKRFYKNLFKDEGYLTFTIPARTELIILSKMLNYAICSFLSLFLCWAQFWLLNFRTISIMGSIFEFFTSLRQFNLSFFNTSAPINFILDNLHFFFMICLPIASTVLVNRYKWLVAIGTFLGISILMIIVRRLLIQSTQIYLLTVQYYNINSIIVAVFITIEFFLISWLCKKKLNLQ